MVVAFCQCDRVPVGLADGIHDEEPWWYISWTSLRHMLYRVLEVYDAEFRELG